MPRFVILRHSLPAGSERQSHWDLMLEEGTSLRTWALVSEPAATMDVEATELADHRLAYLDYEGPVSGNRGMVNRWDAGSYESIERLPDRWCAALLGDRLRGTITLERTEPESHSWRVSFVAAPSRG